MHDRQVPEYTHVGDVDTVQDPCPSIVTTRAVAGSQPTPVQPHHAGQPLPGYALYVAFHFMHDAKPVFAAATPRRAARSPTSSDVGAA